MPFAQMYGEILDFRVKVQEQHLALEEKDERLAKAGLEIDRLKVANGALAEQVKNYKDLFDNMATSPADYSELEKRLQRLAVSSCEEAGEYKKVIEALNDIIITQNDQVITAEEQLKIQTQIAEDAVQKRIEVEEKHQAWKTRSLVLGYGGIPEGFKLFGKTVDELKTCVDTVEQMNSVLKMAGALKEHCERSGKAKEEACKLSLSGGLKMGEMILPPRVGKGITSFPTI
ncbi:MAG: hypothetical protein COC24_013290 [Alphaproteobacteria bacterium]|nr:hypothetical protein [Alphaproteobacteria bacterium]